MGSAASSGYERRIGRYSGPLGVAFADALGLGPGTRVLDVGCGSGALTAAVAARVGVRSVVGVDPAEADLRMCARRVPGVALVRAVAEQLPLAAEAFDVVAAQLVVGLVADPAATVREMRRVCRPGGLVTASVWDFGDGMTVLRAFWDAALAVVPEAGEYDQVRSQRLTDPAALAAAWRQGGLTGVRTSALEVSASYTGPDDLWDPLTVPDGTPGRFLRLLADGERRRIREGLLARLGSPAGSFALRARAWSVEGTVPA